MKSSVGSVSTRGQVTIPQGIRKELGIQPGDNVWITIQGGKIVLRRVDLSIRAGYGSIPSVKPPLRIEDIDQIFEDAVVDEWLEKERRSRRCQ